MAALVQSLAYSGARDSDGDPVSSGYAYFLQPGTVDTQVTAYADSAGAAQLTQPVALDAGGRCTVFLEAQARIKIIDASGEEVETVTSEDKSNTVTAAQVEVEVPGIDGINPDTGATEDGAPTDLATALEALVDSSSVDTDAWVRLSDYAEGDDTTDDTTGIQAWIAAGMANNKGLWVDPGTYRFYTGLTVTGATGAGLVICGANRATCILKNMDVSNSALTIDLSSAIESHIVLRNFAITADTTSSGKGILLTNGNGVRIERVQVTAHRTGFDASSVSHTAFTDCLVTSTDGNAAGVGFKVGAYGRAEKCRVTEAATGTAFSLAGSYGVVDDCKALATTSGTGYVISGTQCRAIDCYSATSTTAFNITGGGSKAINCIAAGTHTTGFILGATYVTATGCYVGTTTTAYNFTASYTQTADCLSTGVATTGYLLASTFAAAYRCTSVAGVTGFSMTAADTTVRDCSAQTATTGISLGAVARGHVVGNKFATNTSDITINASATAFSEYDNDYTTITDGAVDALGLYSGNNWVDKRSHGQQSGNFHASGTFTPSFANGTRLFFIKIADDCPGGQTVTIAAPTATGLPCRQFFVYIDNDSANSVTLTWNTSYNGSPPGSVATKVCYGLTFFGLDATSEYSLAHAPNASTHS